VGARDASGVQTLATGNRAVDSTLTNRSIRAMLGALSPAGDRGRLTILMFHRVHEQPDTLFPNQMHAAVFHERMRWIRNWFNVLPLDHATAALARGSLPERALAITFDDGYADNCTVALPILRDFDLHATFFVSTAFIDGGRMWNDTVIEAVRGAAGNEVNLSSVGLGVHRVATADDRRQAIDAILRRLKYLAPALRQTQADAIAALVNARLPEDLMMTSAQLRTLAAAGMGIGGHTMTHPILAQVEDNAARNEMGGGREALEAMVRQPVRLFAYPNGKPGQDYNATHVRMATEIGFTAAVSTASGAARAGGSLHELPRFTPWGHSVLRWSGMLARNFFTPVNVAAP
jgi:peptidoglycan/xylan/chitin deacetylase (PgdA/CDA1 family)